VTRKDLMYWGTLAIIVFFFLEFFWPLLYSQEEAAATPTPEALKQFTGRAMANARVLYFAGEGFVSCNSSKNRSGFIDELRSSPEVQNVFAVSESGFMLKVNASNETRASEAFARLASLVSFGCGEGSSVLRNAGLELESRNFSFSSLESLNDSRTLYPKDVLDAFRASGIRDVQGFVDAEVPLNESVTISITVQMLGDRLVDKPQIEQLRFTKPFAQ